MDNRTPSPEGPGSVRDLAVGILLTIVSLGIWLAMRAGIGGGP